MQILTLPSQLNNTVGYVGFRDLGDNTREMRRTYVQPSYRDKGLNSATRSVKLSEFRDYSHQKYPYLDEDLRTMLEESTITERKSFIKSIAREITVAGSEVTLSYRQPLLAGMIMEETLSVSSIIHDGGLKKARCYQPVVKCSSIWLNPVGNCKDIVELLGFSYIL
jgi:predicted GNAT family acetyltransferase